MAWVTIESPLSLLVQNRLEVDQLKREAAIDRIKVRFGDLKKNSFLSKIQNRTSEKTGKKILRLSCKKSVKTQFLGVVVFPSHL